MLNDKEFNQLFTFSRNFVTIMMSAFDEAINAIGEVLGEVGAAMTEAFGGDGDEVRAEVKKNLTPDMLKAVRETREGITVDEEGLAEVRAKCPPEQIHKLDEILSTHDVGLPRLDTELSDEDLVGYLALGKVDNEVANNLFDKLQVWMNETQAMVEGESPSGGGDNDDIDIEEIEQIRNGVNEMFDDANASDRALPLDLINAMQKKGTHPAEVVDLTAFMMAAGGDKDTPVSRNAMIDQIIKFDESQKVKLTGGQAEFVESVLFEPEWQEISQGKDSVPFDVLKDNFSEDKLKEIDTKGDGAIDRDEMLEFWKFNSGASDAFEW
jgi:hypothetical protein